MEAKFTWVLLAAALLLSSCRGERAYSVVNDTLREETLYVYEYNEQGESVRAYKTRIEAGDSVYFVSHGGAVKVRFQKPNVNVTCQCYYLGRRHTLITLSEDTVWGFYKDGNFVPDK